ncbi:MAG: hypothetical protein EBZ67_10840, partial [Chitinophagia bacterium]|nr:hypothetical protein [Chitinophagia bacterium]
MVVPVSPVSNTDALLKSALDKYRQADYKGAYDIFSRPELSQNAQAIFYVGAMYSNGLHLAKDPYRGVEYYRRSADMGYA